MQKARVLLVEDHTLVAEGLSKLLDEDFELLGIVADGRALIESVKKLNPDIVVLDISLPLLNGLDAARQIKKTEPQIKLVFLTMHDEEHLINEAFQVGGSGYILKNSAISELVFALKEVSQGKIFISPSVAHKILKHAGNTSIGQTKKIETDQVKLSQRQREILQLAAEGKTNKDIATILNIAVKTVEFHKTRIMQEIGVKSTSELTQFAIKRGVIS